MAFSYLIGVDFGGGASKATLLRETGEVVATATTEYTTHYPHDGWAEQDPDDSYNALVANIRALLAHVDAKNVVGLCLDGATHTVVLLDKRGRVIRPAIYWIDRRSTREAAWLEANHLELIVRQSLNVPSPIWSLPQLMWLRQNEPESFAKIHRVLPLKDYVRYRLTGDFVTDSIEAMGTMMMDVNKDEWSAELCELCGISISSMPQIVSPQQVLGPLTAEAQQATGLSPHTKVIAGATDTVMEVYAAGAIQKGQATIKLATAGRICTITDHAVANPLLINYRHVVPGLWYPGTATKSCAASYRWYRDALCGEESLLAAQQGTDPYFLIDQKAAHVPAGSDDLYFHPYLQGELTPYMDSNLRASFVGASSYHTKGHFSRAVLEGVTYSLRECLDVMRQSGIAPDKATIIGGGAKSPLWSQIAADVLNLPLVKSGSDSSSLGSAMLAGVAAQIFASHEDAVAKCSAVDEEDTILPQESTQQAYERGFTFYRQIHDALAPLYTRMAGEKD